MALNPHSSIRDWADFCDWHAGDSGQPRKSKVHRLLLKLGNLKLATKDRAGQWCLTQKGKDLAKNNAEKANG